MTENELFVDCYLFGGDGKPHIIKMGKTSLSKMVDQVIVDDVKELPKYQSHKFVWALKILSILIEDESAIIVPEDYNYTPFRVGMDYIKKHNPQVGGYYVVYKDGYKSFCPAKEFEEGNTLIK